jgi:circadian clock protein KaiC
MNDSGKPQIRLLASGVPQLDEVLGGGFPEYSLNVIGGDPGSGKTTLCHQILFANATPERPGLYFTVVGEPPLKMLRYQQQFSFFDPDRVGTAVHYVNLTAEAAATGDLEQIFQTIVAEVEQREPAFVVVDSFRSLVETTTATEGARNAESARSSVTLFLARLTVFLSSQQVTSFVIGEYAAGEARNIPVFSIADGIVWLSQSMHRNSMVRKLQVLKMRGLDTQPGLHTVRITAAGVQVFPRMVKPIEVPQPGPEVEPGWHSTGVAGLDDMLGGGLIPGSAVLVAGPVGSGKSTVALQFLAEGARLGQPGVLAMFEEMPHKYVEQASGFGIDLLEMERQGLLTLVYVRPLDLSVDETLHEIQAAVSAVGARRIVIDSLTGLEIALAPTFEQDFRESLYRLVGALTGAGITIVMTVEVTDSYTELRFSPHAVSFMTNDIVLQRYVEIDAQLRRAITVVKSRSRAHSSDIRGYDIGANGVVVGERLLEFEGLIAGVARRRGGSLAPAGLTDREQMVLEELRTVTESSEQDLAQRTGFQRPVVRRALNRLIELRYAEKAGDGIGVRCRASQRS